MSKVGKGTIKADDAVTALGKAAEAIEKYGDDAARAIERGIEPSIINRLADVEVTPSLYETLGITSRESAESLLSAIARRLSRTATQADIDLISALRIKYNARATRNIAFAKGNIGGNVIDLETISGEAMRGNFTPPSTNYYQGRLEYQYHTEQNIIEYLRETYKNNPNISGRIEIVSERAYCDNCVDIVDQFQAEFKNIEVIRVETQ